MGGGNSKELENEQRRRDEISSSNQREMAGLRNYHREQADRMQQELASRNADLERIRRNAMESQRRNEEELRATRQRQAERAAQLEEQRAAELASLRDGSEKEKQRVNEQFEKRAAQLKSEHDEVVRKMAAEREEEKKKAEAAIRKAEAERDAVERQKLEDVRKHREALDEMSKEHRREINEHYEKLNAEMEKNTLAAINRISVETEQRLAIIDASQAQMQQDAIEGKFRNFAKQYLTLMDRAKKLEDAIGGMMELMPTNMTETVDDKRNNSNTIKSNDVPYELSDLHNEYRIEADLLEREMSKMRQQLKTSFDIPENFKDVLMEPLEPYDESNRKIKPASLKITMAIHKNDGSELGPVRERLSDHLEVLRGTIKGMNAVEYKKGVETALKNMAQRSIQQ